MENLERNEKERKRNKASKQMKPTSISFVEKNIRLSKEHSPEKLKEKLDQIAAKKKKEHESRLAALKMPAKNEPPSE